MNVTTFAWQRKVEMIKVKLLKANRWTVGGQVHVQKRKLKFCPQGQSF